MSVQSDDTDLLLLIPPDFFLVPSDSEKEPSRNSVSESLIVSDLITQVNDLEGRICLIEDHCLNESAMTGNLLQLRHYGSADTLNYSVRSSFNTRSLQATPNKSGFSPKKYCDRSPLKRTSYTMEMRDNLLTSTEYTAQKDRDEQLLREVDQFFKNKRISEDDVSEKEVTLGKPERLQLSTAVSNLNKVNDLLKKLHETQKEIEDKVKLKEVVEIETEDSLNLECADKVLEVPYKSISDGAPQEEMKNAKRFLNFDEEGKERIISSPEFHCGEDVCINSKNKCTELSEKKPGTQEFTNLPSLSNLWGSSTNISKTISQTEEDQILKHRLQEEKCRRQHCETLIQKLQLRLLEEQQKVAVAMKIDHEKDQAISKLTEGWNKLVVHWRDLENQRNNLAKKLISDREKFKSETCSAYQTVKRYEVELSKALDLAHGYKEKCEASEKDKKTLRMNLTKDLEGTKNEFKDAMEKLKTAECKIERLEKMLSAKDEVLNQSKAKLSEMQNQMREGKKTLKELQTELENVKIEREKLTEKLKEERNRVSSVEQSRKTLQHQNEELKRKEKLLKDDVKVLTDQMDKVKVELKEFYQEQVESIVQEKLKEFQEQLATAEKTLQAEIEMREKAVTELAVKQVQQIVEKHLNEINMLEEKQKEESELWKVKLNQKDEKIKELQQKLEQYSNNKTVIAQRLHSVMEAQWQEALKIITSSSPQQTKSPGPGSEKAVARQKTFSMNGSGDGNNKSVTSTDVPFCEEEMKTGDALTYRVDETPQKMMSDHLQKYIRALLAKAPGHPTNDSLDRNVYKCIEPISDESSLNLWQHVLSDPSSSQLPSDMSKYSDSCNGNCNDIVRYSSQPSC